MTVLVKTILELAFTDVTPDTNFDAVVLDYLIEITHGALDADFNNFEIISIYPSDPDASIKIVRVRVGDDNEP